MSNKNKSSYQKTIDTLEEKINPEGYTISDVIVRRVKWIGILMFIGLIYNFFNGKSDNNKTTNKETSSEIIPLKIEKREYSQSYTDKIVSDLNSQLPIQTTSGNIKITSISHKNRQINLEMVMTNANPTQTWQARKFYCEKNEFKPFMEQDIDTNIKVMNENNSIAFETQIQGADCP